MIGILARLSDGGGVDVVCSSGVTGVDVLAWYSAGLLVSNSAVVTIVSCLR